MDAFLFTLALFGFWTLIGFATLSVFSPRLRVMQSVLISPAMGIAVTLLCVFFINRAGVPVKDFAHILLPALAGLSILALVIKRPAFPFKQSLPFLGILIVALLLVANPMFSYGFDWVSFANDDMANYSLGAQRFLNNGFFEPINIEAFDSGKDYSQAYWVMHVAANTRSGSELMLAAIWAFSGLNAHQIFMPVIIALHLALIASTGAMVSGNGDRKRTPLIAMSFMALSPLTALGALYQLIGQVGGLVLLITTAVLMFRTQHFRSLPRFLGSNIPAVITFCALTIWYPEVIPFLGLGWFLYVFMLRRDLSLVQQAIKVALVIGFMALIVLNTYILTTLFFILQQFLFSTQATVTNSLFPFYLRPSGLPTLWGMIPLTGILYPYLMSFLIAMSLGLFFWLGICVIPFQIRHAKPPFALLLGMIVIGFVLGYTQNGFGLYKLAMYIQPFLMSVIALEVSHKVYKNKKFIQKSIAYGLLSMGLICVSLTQFEYVKQSYGKQNGGLNELPLASSLKLNSQFKNTIHTIKENFGTDIQLVSTTNNLIIAKFQSLYAQDLSIFFPSKFFFESTIKSGPLSQFTEKHLGENTFKAFKIDTRKNKKIIYIYSLMKPDIFNAYYSNLKMQNRYFILDEDPKNYLLFIHSDLGNHYYLGNRKKISFYQLEDDPLFPGQTFSALGRHFLFQTLNPTPGSRLMMELTNTVVKQFDSTLPLPKVQNITLPFVGRGSGRIFSAPIEPTYIEQTPYISVDIGRDPQLFSFSSTGLMSFYGKDIPLDLRLISTFGRDISLISEEQYQALQPSTHLQNFPEDLADKNLEYSGIYEDAWISEQSFFVLLPQPESKWLVLKGFIPLLANPQFSTILTVNLDGQQVAQQKLFLGDFNIKIPVSALQGRQRIDITFSDHQQLPGLDGRIIGGKVNFIGFTE